MFPLPVFVILWRIINKNNNKHCLRELFFAEGLYAGGIICVCIFVLGYFQYFGALKDFTDALIGFNYSYFKMIQTNPEKAKWWCCSFWLKYSLPYLLVLTVLFIYALRTYYSEKKSYMISEAFICLGLAVLSLVSVLFQLKFYAYHWAVTIPFFILCGAYGVAEMRERNPGPLYATIVVLFLASFFTAPQWKNDQKGTYRSYIVSLGDYLRGVDSREAFLKSFLNPFGVPYLEEEKIGLKLKEMAGPDDLLLVKSYDTPVYAVSAMRCNSRFFWDLPHLWNPELQWYKEHSAEYQQDFRQSPPEFIVCLKKDRGALAWFLDNGYRIAAGYERALILVKKSIPTRETGVFQGQHQCP